MTDLFDRLTSEPDHAGNEDDRVYDLAKIRATAHRCIELEPGLLAVDIVDDLHVSFCVFEFHSGPATKDGVIVEGEKMKLVFRGSGPSGSLRELRHTYWGEPDNSGYIFYVNFKVITNAFAALKEWFDGD